MKKFCIPFISFCFLLCLGFSSQNYAQRYSRSHELAGSNLDRLERRYERSLDRGDYSVLVPYAEFLYFQREYEDAFQMYKRAIEKGLTLDEQQQRNFVHIARLLGEPDPLKVGEDYFKPMPGYIGLVKAYCNNSSNEDLAPFVWHDKLFVTSSRTDRRRTRGRDTYTITQLPFLNVFAFDQQCDQTDLDFLPSDINTRLHSGPIAIKSDTSLVVVNRNYRRPNRDGIQTLYFGYYTRDQRGWSREKIFPYSSEDYSVQHPFFDEANNVLYFASNMPGGYGGFDLYKSRWDGSNWSQPVNLGPEINTEYDEVFPAKSPDGTLFFSTNHLQTKGGLDIVRYFNGKIYLLPEEINSANDDFGITFLTDSTGYFTSNRAAETFGDNIYSFELRSAFEFIVRVIDQVTGAPIQGAEITYSVVDLGIEGRAVSDSRGEVSIHYGSEEPFMIDLEIKKDGYFSEQLSTDEFRYLDNKWVNLIGLRDKEGFFVVYFDNNRPNPGSRERTTDLTYVETFNDYILRRDHFLLNSASSDDEVMGFFNEVRLGMQQLEDLAAFLHRHMDNGWSFTIAFTSHTSPLGDRDYNMLLSDRRFHAVENYLKTWKYGALSNFIDKGQLIYSHRAIGPRQADPRSSHDPRDRANAIYGVPASMERKVTITWERKVPR